MNQDWINALAGGALIGIAVSIMLVFNGRVTGISGIISGALTPKKGDSQWRFFFIGGLLLGGLILVLLRPDLIAAPVATPTWRLVAAGLLVGFGTLVGSGCTSGHGVCGISRLSIRSILATLTFMAAGMGAVALLRALGGLS
jgi:uncharacterized membrane protein YedE/YeeE